MRTHRLNIVIGVLSLSALSLVACGGDDGGVAGDAGISADSGSDDPMSTIDPGDIAAAGDLLGLSEKCTEIYTSMVNAFASMGSTDDSVKSTFDALVAEFSTIRDQVPGDLKDDVDVLAQEYARYGELLAKYADDPNAYMDPEKMAEFDSVMTSDEFYAANERFSTWLDTECAVGS